MSAPSTSSLLVVLPSRVIYVSMVAFPFFLPLISFRELTGSLIGQIYTHCLFFLFFQKGI